MLCCGTFAKEVRWTNPDSTVVINTRDGERFRRFDKIYLCFHALKVGFISGRRHIISVDYYFLKTASGGGGKEDYSQ